MKTRLIRDALILDLGDINGTGNFVTNVQEISPEPRSIAHIRHPGIIVEPDEGGGTDDPDTLSARKSVVDQIFNLRLVIASTTPHDAIQDFIDDVRNAIERRDGNSYLCALSYVWHATVDTWQKKDLEKTGQQQRITAEVSVRVRYNHTRGAA